MEKILMAAGFVVLGAWFAVLFYTLKEAISEARQREKVAKFVREAAQKYEA